MAILQWSNKKPLISYETQYGHSKSEKSEELVTNATAASKYMPKRPRICINGNPPFRPHFLKFSKPDFLHNYRMWMPCGSYLVLEMYISDFAK